MNWMFVSPQNLYVEAPSSNVTVFEDRPFMDVINVKWGHKGGTLILQDSCPSQESSFSLSAMWGHSKVTICKAERELLIEANPVRPWSRTSRLQDHEKIKFCCFSLPAYGILLWQPELTNTPDKQNPREFIVFKEI